MIFSKRYTVIVSSHLLALTEVDVQQTKRWKKNSFTISQIIRNIANNFFPCLNVTGLFQCILCVRLRYLASSTFLFFFVSFVFCFMFFYPCCCCLALVPIATHRAACTLHTNGSSLTYLIFFPFQFLPNDVSYSRQR